MEGEVTRCRVEAGLDMFQGLCFTTAGGLTAFCGACLSLSLSAPFTPLCLLEAGNLPSGQYAEHLTYFTFSPRTPPSCINITNIVGLLEIELSVKDTALTPNPV